MNNSQDRNNSELDSQSAGYLDHYREGSTSSVQECISNSNLAADADTKRLMNCVAIRSPGEGEIVKDMSMNYTKRKGDPLTGGSKKRSSPFHFQERGSRSHRFLHSPHNSQIAAIEGLSETHMVTSVEINNDCTVAQNKKAHLGCLDRPPTRARSQHSFRKEVVIQGSLTSPL